MSNSIILGADRAPTRASGRDADLLGPSDTSDSGSDIQGESTMATGADNPGELGSLTTELDSDSDASGTGERASAAGDAGRDGSDILPDQIIEPGVEGDALLDTGLTDADIEALGDVEEGGDADDDGESGDDATGANDATSAESDSGDTARAGGRVHSLPAGTLEAADEQ